VPASLRILGIDPGLQRTGFGVIDQAGTRLRFVECGVLRIASDELPARLGAILAGLTEVIERTRPTVAAVEKVFVNVNPQSTLLLGQARGAAIAALVAQQLAVREYTALQVKQAVTGHGKADKAQVQAMVQRLLALPQAPEADAADALACAICHAHSGGLLHAVARSGRAAPRGGWRVRGGRLLA
jgi:crossover junction endodeoxyribonuclease RuvC